MSIVQRMIRGRRCGAAAGMGSIAGAVVGPNGRRSVRGSMAGESFRSIASRLGRVTSTISREVKANGGRGGYRGWRAHRRASDLARRPKIAKLAGCARLRAQVETWLEDELWSPQQISAQLRIEFPDDPMMRVSHETIYQSLYVQGRGALRKSSLPACAPGGRSAATGPASSDAAGSPTWS